MFDPQRPTLKSRLKSGPCLGVFWLALGSVALVEAAARARPDAIVIDMQHGLWDRVSLELAIGVVPSEIPVIVRVAENTALAIGGALDAGAEGVMVPMIDTAAEAARTVALAKYPPHGIRSAGGVRPLRDFAAYMKGAEALAVMVMIETVEGLAQAPSIAAVPGLDMVFIGTGDLALTLQIGEGDAARHAAACTDIQRACEAAALPCGIFTGDGQAAMDARAAGYGMVVMATDIDLAVRGFNGARARFAEA